LPWLAQHELDHFQPTADPLFVRLHAVLQYLHVPQEPQREQRALQQLVQQLVLVSVLVVRQPELLEQELKRQVLFQFGQKLQEQAL
jgi:hypothetical protein